MDLSVVIPTVNEAGNIERVIPDMERVARELNLAFEIIVVDGGSTHNTAEIARRSGDSVKVVLQKERGYGGAIKEGLQQAIGEYILTMDADCSHDPHFLENFWKARESAEVIIGSRYVRDGKAAYHAGVTEYVIYMILEVLAAVGLYESWRKRNQKEKRGLGLLVLAAAWFSQCHRCNIELLHRNGVICLW
jgi:glycosyltransferase involved in cell wall biosynthesis